MLKTYKTKKAEKNPLKKINSRKQTRISVLQKLSGINFYFLFNAING